MPTAKQPVSFASLPEAKLLQIVAECDGWTIFPASYLIEAGVPREMLGTLVTKHKSDGTGKGSITVNGQLVDSMEGVYGLSMLRRICRDLGVDDHTDFMGRGTEARELVRRIREHFAPAAKA